VHLRYQFTVHQPAADHASYYVLYLILCIQIAQVMFARELRYIPVLACTSTNPFNVLPFAFSITCATT